eukprot:TRINITY_DN8072_c0_g1_i1.p1 TRINITY_DN8072_c0_g1~~TRINITY_DN8072_c0_g1_i1.p1  ORF type:complete len:412 (+),score=71.99 TRINITY_DN8072_c0_g1_i1:60-1238(+)
MHRGGPPRFTLRFLRVVLILGLLYGTFVYARWLSMVLHRTSVVRPLHLLPTKLAGPPQQQKPRTPAAVGSTHSVPSEEHVHAAPAHQATHDPNDEPNHGSGKDTKERQQGEAEGQAIPAPLADLVITRQPPPGTEHSDLCPICGETKHTPHVQEKGYHLVKCSHCGFLYVNPMPFTIDANNKTYRERWEDVKVTAMKRKVTEFFAPDELRQVRRWLDVGCGNGELLKAVQELNPGCNATGVETTLPKIKTARRKGLAVFQRPLESFDTHSFDVVTAMNVLSHVPRPVEFYKAIARLVKPTGCMWISTGNAADIAAKEAPSHFDLPDHLVFAGKRHVYTIFHRAGLQVVEYREFKHFWHNYPPLRRGPFRAIYAKACGPQYVPPQKPVADESQ